jgi:hypothetical protein
MATPEDDQAQTDSSEVTDAPADDEAEVPGDITESDTTENRFAALEDRIARLEDALGIHDGVVE